MADRQSATFVENGLDNAGIVNTDTRTSTRPVVAQTTIIGGVGAVAAPTPPISVSGTPPRTAPTPMVLPDDVPRTLSQVSASIALSPAVRPLPSASFTQSAVPVVPPVVTPTVVAPAPIPIQPKPIPTLPKLPNQSGDADGKHGIKQHPERYKVVSDKWSITAGTRKLEQDFGSEWEYVPVLGVNDVVVKVKGKYLISPQTLANVRGLRNPHYDIKPNGSVMGVPMGSSIPVIEVDTDKLVQLGKERDDLNHFAAVRDVVYINETEEVAPGIPKGLVDQINYTLDPKTVRPKDTFSIWNVNLNADYSMQSLLADTKQAYGQVDYGKVRQYLLGANAKINDLRRDFNTIKELYYKGTIPTSVNGAVEFTQQATGTDDAKSTGGKSFVLTEPSILTEFKRTPEEVAALTAKILADSKQAEEKATYDRLLSKWNAYGFTNDEKAYLYQKAANFSGLPLSAAQTDIGLPMVINTTGDVKGYARIANLDEVGVNPARGLAVDGVVVYPDNQWMQSIADKAGFFPNMPAYDVRVLITGSIYSYDDPNITTVPVNLETVTPAPHPTFTENIGLWSEAQIGGTYGNEQNYKEINYGWPGGDVNRVNPMPPKSHNWTRDTMVRIINRLGLPNRSVVNSLYDMRTYYGNWKALAIWWWQENQRKRATLLATARKVYEAEVKRNPNIAQLQPEAPVGGVATAPAAGTPSPVPQAQIDAAVNAAVAAALANGQAQTAAGQAVQISAATRADQITQWRSYGFTDTEKNSLKNPSGISVTTFGSWNTGPVNVTYQGRTINVNIIWLPGILNKARILDPFEREDALLSSQTMNNAVSYFGSAPTSAYFNSGKFSYWKPLNDQRKAALIALAADIKSYERTTGLFY